MRKMVIYEATRGDETVRGSGEEIAAAVGKSPHYVYTIASRGFQTREGWKIRRVGVLAHEYTAEKPGEDSIVGSSEEIACLLGITSASVTERARNGNANLQGWTFTGKIKEFRED